MVQFVEEVANWVSDVEVLTKIAKDESQLVYAAYCKSMQHRWVFLQRKIPGIAHLFQPLENAIGDWLIPALVGRDISDTERRTFALPLRFGGLGITNPVAEADAELACSMSITAPLIRTIQHQSFDISDVEFDEMERQTSEAKKEKNARFSAESDKIAALLNDDRKKYLQLASEKGSSCWLSVIPSKNYGFLLNKQEFRDAICLRYGFPIRHTPSHCACGALNDLNHTLNCKKDGYVSMWHNTLFLKGCCKDVKLEPSLLPVLTDDTHEVPGVQLRLDVYAMGLWSTFKRSFLDICMTHPLSPSYAGSSTKSLLRQHEKEKKRKYQERVLNVERGSFTPVVFTTTGGCGEEANKLHKRIAHLIVEKRKEKYADTLRFMRTKLSFALL